MKNFFKTIFGWVLWVYLFGVMISGAYYNWDYARENGFWEWVWFGEVIATIKAPIWPYLYYVKKKEQHIFYTSWNEKDRENSKHFFNSYDAAHKAIDISNKGSAFTEISQEDYFLIIQYYMLALSEAKQIDDHVLDLVHPELKLHFRNEYQKGLQYILKYYETEDFNSQIKSSLLNDSWVDWFNGNKGKIKFPKTD